MLDVCILYGSESDKEYMEPGREYLNREAIPYRERVLSAHRDFDRLPEELDELDADPGVGVVIAVAGLSAALPGVVATAIRQPVIGVPVPAGPLNGIDALLAITQVPGGVAGVSVGLHSKAPLNACQFAHKILSLGRSPHS